LQYLQENNCFCKRSPYLLTILQLIVAMNLHQCNDTQKASGRAPAVVTKYQKRISGLMLNRFDIHIEVPRVDADPASERMPNHYIWSRDIGILQQVIHSNSAS